MKTPADSRRELIEDLVLELSHELGITGMQIIGWPGPGLLRRDARLVVCQMGRDRILHFPKKFLASGAEIDGQPAEQALREIIRTQLKVQR